MKSFFTVFAILLIITGITAFAYNYGDKRSISAKAVPVVKKDSVASVKAFK